MKGDEYLCTTCEMKWVEENEKAVFCKYCYSKDIINLSAQKRVRERKKLEEDAARKRKEEKIKREKEYRARLLKNRDTAKTYFRGKGKK